MMVLLRVGISISAFLVLCSPALANIGYSIPTEPNTFAKIKIQSDIKASDAAAFKSAYAEITKPENIAKLPRNSDGMPFVYVAVDSLGGDGIAAMEIGRLIRQNKMFTYVSNNGSCASACIIILAGGVTRGIPDHAHIGIHRPHFDTSYFAGLSSNDAAKEYAKLTKTLTDYFDEMGISPKLAEDMMRIASNKAKWLSAKEVQDYGLDGQDPAFEEWNHAKRIDASGAATVDKQDKNLDCINAGQQKKYCDEHYPMQ